MDATTLTALMEANRGVARSVVYLHGEGAGRAVEYGELHERALGILHHLQRLGSRRGDRLILLLSDNEPFIDAFWAALLGGIVPVPVAPGISDEHRRKLLRIARRLGQPFLYTERRLLERLGAFAAAEGESPLYQQLRARTFLADELESIARAGRVHHARPEDVAFIQFSSGSTSAPKGVVLTHANLMANIRGVGAAAQLHDRDVGLSWMPLTHDMGLIGFHLMMFAYRMRMHLMPTELFVRRPLLWLQQAARVRATLLCSPNFGYRHYLKVLAQRPPEALDLSAVRLIFNGAEPISVELCEEFLGRLAPSGLARSAMFPVYGLAEATLAVSFPQPGAPARALCLDRHQLSVGEPVRELAPGATDALRLMSVGRAVPHCELRVADETGLRQPAQCVGHIQIRGASVTGGYFEDPAGDAAAFTADGWLRTGDLGLIHDGELYVAGREKEILFVNGQNYFPHDLEAIAARLEGLESGKVVVAAARPRGADCERLLAFVLHRGELAEFLPLARRLVHALGEQAGIELDAVVPVRRIPKTTSGKIQRHLLEQEYLDGAFDAQLQGIAALGGAQAGDARPAGRVEQQLLEICETELEGRRIDPEESLFDLGASSLKLIAIHERIERLWPATVDMTDLFDHPTVRDLAAVIQARRAAGAPAAPSG
jgi:acyl-CoA synthetase (AMP-forming)/AMP-acid ligase II/acyl carrier protein